MIYSYYYDEILTPMSISDVYNHPIKLHGSEYIDNRIKSQHPCKSESIKEEESFRKLTNVQDSRSNWSITRSYCEENSFYRRTKKVITY